MSKSGERCPLSLVISGTTIIASGDFEDTPECRQTILEPVQKMKSSSCRNWLINPADARIARGGEVPWIEAVCAHLSEHELVYRPSQLAMLCRYADDYTHPHSTYEEY